MAKKHPTQIKFQLEVIVFKEGDAFVAYCPSLNLATQGMSLGEAKKAFDEALDIFLEEVQESGTLEDVLKDCGWRKKDSNWITPSQIEKKQVAIPA